VREADRSPPSSAEIKMSGAIPPLLHTNALYRPTGESEHGIVLWDHSKQKDDPGHSLKT
jgi:hypothetical protein